MKKIFSTLAVAAALFAGYSVYSGQNSNELTDVALANVEALASSSESSLEIEVCGCLWGVCEGEKEGPWVKVEN